MWTIKPTVPKCLFMNLAWWSLHDYLKITTHSTIGPITSLIKRKLTNTYMYKNIYMTNIQNWRRNINYIWFQYQLNDYRSHLCIQSSNRFTRVPIFPVGTKADSQTWWNRLVAAFLVSSYHVNLQLDGYESSLVSKDWAVSDSS